jgi:uncharacterized protein (UPF0332 family)
VKYSFELLETAKRLLTPKEGQAPSRSDCNRAVSTLYYALFDRICEALANRIVGEVSESSPSRDEWLRVYRSIDHAVLASALFRVAKSKIEEDKFSDLIAATFKRCQDMRTTADYDRTQDVDLDAAKQLHDETYTIISIIAYSDDIGFDAERWLTLLVLDLFFSKSKR